VQHEPASRLNRAADVNRHVPNLVRNGRLIVLVDDAETLQQIGKGNMGGALIDDESHGAIFGVRAHVDDRSRKTRVRHHWHCDEELTVEIAIAGGAVRIGFGYVHALTLTCLWPGCEAQLVALDIVPRRGGNGLLGTRVFMRLARRYNADGSPCQTYLEGTADA